MIKCDRCGEKCEDSNEYELCLKHKYKYLGTKYADITCHVCKPCGKAIGNELPGLLAFRISLPPKPSRWRAVAFFVLLVLVHVAALLAFTLLRN